MASSHQASLPPHSSTVELYYGVSGHGAVLHTINPRLFPDIITWIANHAEDR
jgi:3-(methylthio)propionyl---CoA ligase